MECDSVHLLYRKCSRAFGLGGGAGRRAVPEREAEEDASSAMEMGEDGTAGGPRNSEQKLMETKKEK